MYFLLALGLSIYLCFKIGNDKLKTRRHQRQYDEAKALADEFYKKYSVTTEERYAIEDMVLKSTPEMQEFENELTRVVGIKPTRPMLVWGYLAQKGQIPDALANDYNSDIPFSWKHDLIWSGITVWKDVGRKNIGDARLKFLIWYDEELRKKGMEHQLMFIPAHIETVGEKGWQREEPYFSIEDARPISECTDLYQEEPIQSPVTVLWLPTKIRVPNMCGVV